VRGLSGDPFELPPGAAPPAGRRTELPHVFIAVAKPRLDPCSQRFSRAPSRPHALPRLLQVDVSTSTTTDHSRHPRPPESGWGGCHRRVKVAFRPGQPPELHKDRGREHRTSALPSEIAPAGDFAPTSMTPGTSCREDHSFPCPERRGKRVEPPAQRALAERTERQGRAACHLREEGGRSPTRGAFCPQTARKRTGVSADVQPKLDGNPRQRLFHHRET
jgi:hypothetical protein